MLLHCLEGGRGWRGGGRMGRGGQRLVSDNDRHKMTCIQHCSGCNLKYPLQVKGLLVQSKKSASGKNKITQQRKKEERNLMLIKRHKILMPSLLYHHNSAHAKKEKKKRKKKEASSSLQRHGPKYPQTKPDCTNHSSCLKLKEK